MPQHRLTIPLSRDAQIAAAARGDPAETPAAYDIPPELVERLAALPWSHVHEDGSVICEVHTRAYYDSDPLSPVSWRRRGGYGCVEAAPAAVRPATPAEAVAEAERIAGELQAGLERRLEASRQAVREWASLAPGDRDNPAYARLGDLARLAREMVPDAVAEYEAARAARERAAQEAAARREAEQAAARELAWQEAIAEIAAREAETAAHLSALRAEGFSEDAARQAQEALLRLRTPEGWAEIDSLVPGAASTDERERLRIAPAELAAYRAAREAQWPHVRDVRLAWVVWLDEDGGTLAEGPALVAEVTAPALGPRGARARTVARRLS
jgi:hypothetical protein